MEHGYAQPVLAVLLQQLARQPRRFTPEHEVILRPEAGLGVKPGPAGLDEPKPGARRQPLLERGPAWPPMPLHVLPVVHPGPFELGFVQLKAKWLDQIQRGPRGRAQSGHVSRVGWDFRLNQDDVHEVLRLWTLDFLTSVV